MKASHYYAFVRFVDMPPAWNFQDAKLPKVWQVTLWAVHLGTIVKPELCPLGEAVGIGDTFEEAHAAALRKLRSVMAKVPVV